MTSMKARIITAVIGIPLVLLFLFIGTQNLWVVTVFISAVTALMCAELLTAKKIFNKYSISIPCVIFSFLLPLFSHTQYVLLMVFAFIVTIFLSLMINYTKLSFDDISFAFTGTFIISSGMACLNYLVASYESFTAFFLTLILAVPWMADAGAYFAGTFFGKHKLCPNISPKKTIEGFFGGVVFCIITSILVGLIYQSFIYNNININYYSLLIIGVMDSVISVIGDLSFSLIKRHCNIKDYGSIFPGHGGMLDRLDSVIFTAPLVLLVHQFLPVIM